VHRVRVGRSHGTAQAHRPGLPALSLSYLRRKSNERSGTLLNRAQYPSDVIAFVVLWRLC
jgi:hypothetical protein